LTRAQEAAYKAFKESLREEGTNLTKLAKVAKVGRAALNTVLHGGNNGLETWKHVLPLLTRHQVACLKKTVAWNSAAKAELMRIHGVGTWE
jgi:hypothetical protein